MEVGRTLPETIESGRVVGSMLSLRILMDSGSRLRSTWLTILMPNSVTKTVHSKWNKEETNMAVVANSSNNPNNNNNMVVCNNNNKVVLCNHNSNSQEEAGKDLPETTKWKAKLFMLSLKTLMANG